jgi:hypothetical protein
MTGAAIILIFPSINQVLNAEDLLEEQGLPFDLIPVPKEVNPNCGLAISLEAADLERILAALAAAGLKTSAAYRREGGAFTIL